MVLKLQIHVYIRNINNRGFAVNKMESIENHCFFFIQLYKFNALPLRSASFTLVNTDNSKIASLSFAFALRSTLDILFSIDCWSAKINSKLIHFNITNWIDTSFNMRNTIVFKTTYKYGQSHRLLEYGTRIGFQVLLLDLYAFY